MSRWFRHYAGMMRDDKLVRVAVKSKQTVERVVWVWGAILESAAEINDAGRYEFDAGEAAYFLRCDEDDIVCVLQCLEDIGRIHDGVVAKWSDRQFDSDSSKERQRRYRERRKACGDVQQRDGDVGETSRDGGVTLQETETETELEDSSLRSESIERERKRGKSDFQSWFETWPTFASDDAEKALAAWQALSANDRSAVIAGTPGYIATVKASNRKTWHSADKFLAERLWTRVQARASPSSFGLGRQVRQQTREEYLEAELKRSERSFR